MFDKRLIDWLTDWPASLLQSVYIWHLAFLSISFTFIDGGEQEDEEGGEQVGGEIGGWSLRAARCSQRIWGESESLPLSLKENESSWTFDSWFDKDSDCDFNSCASLSLIDFRSNWSRSLWLASNHRGQGLWPKKTLVRKDEMQEMQNVGNWTLSCVYHGNWKWSQSQSNIFHYNNNNSYWYTKIPLRKKERIL